MADVGSIGNSKREIISSRGEDNRSKKKQGRRKREEVGGRGGGGGEKPEIKGKNPRRRPVGEEAGEENKVDQQAIFYHSFIIYLWKFNTSI